MSIRWIRAGIGFVVLLASLASLGSCRTVTPVAAPRAYLLIGNVRLVEPLHIGSRMELHYTIKNSGTLPAGILGIAHQLYLADQALPVPVLGYYKPSTQLAVLGPGDSKESPDAPSVWLDHQDGRVWTVGDAAARQHGQRLWVQIVVYYNATPASATSIQGLTAICGYHEGSSAVFTACADGTILR